MTHLKVEEWNNLPWKVTQESITSFYSGIQLRGGVKKRWQNQIYHRTLILRINEQKA